MTIGDGRPLKRNFVSISAYWRAMTGWCKSRHICTNCHTRETDFKLFVTRPGGRWQSRCPRCLQIAKVRQATRVEKTVEVLTAGHGRDRLVG